MGIHLLGTGELIFTIGMAHCDEAGCVLPFIAYGPYDKIAPELDHDTDGQLIDASEQVASVVKVFGKYGSILFLNTMDAYVDMAKSMAALTSYAITTEWGSRKPKTVTIN